MQARQSILKPGDIALALSAFSTMAKTFRVDGASKRPVATGMIH